MSRQNPATMWHGPVVTVYSPGGMLERMMPKLQTALTKLERGARRS